MRLEKFTIYGWVPARKAVGALAANRLVVVVASTEGFGVKQIVALADKPFGVTGDDSWADGQMASIFRKNVVVPIVCADAGCAENVSVYNTATGKVSATQGAGASLVGTTMSKTDAADELISVDLTL
ncbi:MAG: hypothetical protein M3547_00150 [Acidobacteriota bacterium]|nr:hypothetical protein [Acidobacteriota bacterium]